jgi:hypothetical protein
MDDARLHRRATGVQVAGTGGRLRSPRCRRA